ncbi:MAG: hypothetical protein KQI78_21325, partial [Deltaproteobacteria bacterium]|nr:hypothetical protein [Deltaproteobacteria bacterium]
GADHHGGSQKDYDGETWVPQHGYFSFEMDCWAIPHPEVLAKDFARAACRDLAKMAVWISCKHCG